MRRRMAGLTKTWLCVAAALALAGCGTAAPEVDHSGLPLVGRPLSPGSATASPQNATASVTVPPSPSPTAEPSPRPSVSTSAPEPTATSAPADPTTEPPTEQELLEAEAVELTNAERAGAGCPEVHIDDRLVTAARAHSEDMVERDFFDHTNPDGEGPGDRARAAGYDWLAISENIAWGYRTAEDVVAGWMDSAGHRRNILDCDAVAVGVGVADSDRGPYWTQVFGRE